VNPTSLNIRSWEAAFAALFHSFVGTPRAAKPFSNVYRLLNAGLDADTLAQFEGALHSPGDFRAVMVLLAMLTGFPELVPKVFGFLRCACVRFPGDRPVGGPGEGSPETRDHPFST